MIYDWTDQLFKFRIWHICKWITGVIICGFLLFWMWDINNYDFLGKSIRHYWTLKHPKGFLTITTHTIPISF